MSEPRADDTESVPVDDAVIGRVFWWSLMVVAGVALVVAAVWYARRPGPTAPSGSAERATAPLQSTPAAPAETVPSIPFVDVTRAAGVDFDRVSGADGRKLLPETLGGGGGFVDVDADGDADLVLLDGDAWPDAPSGAARGRGVVVLLNDGRGTFTLAPETGLESPGQLMGFAAADLDGDGLPELAVTSVDGVRLYRNATTRGKDAQVRFVDITDQSGIDDKGWSTTAMFFDADGDGALDLVVGHYVVWSPEIDLKVDYRLDGVNRAYGPPLGFEGTQLSLWRNDGKGRFTEVSESAGLRVVNASTGVAVAKTLGLLLEDINDDGRLDLFVANDRTANFLFENPGDGHFREIGAAAGVAYDRSGNATGAMGVDSARLRSPRDLAIAVGNFANEPSSLYCGRTDRARFSDDALVEGVGAATRLVLTFGTLFGDFDLDGRPDLAFGNGHLEEQIESIQASQQYRQRGQLFWNAGPTAPRLFVEIPSEKIGDLSKPIVGRALASADIDGDGDLDLLLTQPQGPALLLRNDQAIGHHFVRVRLRGAAPNTDAIGARVECEAGGATQVQWVQPSRSYLSANELPLTFGVGNATQAKVRIRWPDGALQEVTPELDRLTEVVQPQRQPQPQPQPQPPPTGG